MWFRKKTNKPFTPQTFGSCTVRAFSLEEWQALRAFYLRALKEDPTSSPEDYDDMKNLPPEGWKMLIEHALIDPGSFLGQVSDPVKGTVTGLVYIKGRPEYKRSHESDLIMCSFLDSTCTQDSQESVLASVLTHLKESKGLERVKVAISSQDRSMIILFNKLGFRRYGYDEQYFRLGKKYFDAILMLKQL